MPYFNEPFNQTDDCQRFWSLLNLYFDCVCTLQFITSARRPVCLTFVIQLPSPCSASFRILNRLSRVLSLMISRMSSGTHLKSFFAAATIDRTASHRTFSSASWPRAWNTKDEIEVMINFFNTIERRNPILYVICMGGFECRCKWKIVDPHLERLRNFRY